jgi:hypothetical protein
MNDGPISLDSLARDIVARSGYRFTIAGDEAARDVAYRLRYSTIADRGWQQYAECRNGRDCDEWDPGAVHVVGWDGDTPFATGRLVLPGVTLPTELACGIVVEPRGEVIDVGRMTVARSHQGPGHAGFVALLARLYLEVRARGFLFACGVMSPRARSVLRLLGLSVELLGPDRPHWGEPRAPVRFAVLVDTASLSGRWR